MTYTLRPSIVPRERILTFGVQGTGKSTAVLEIARRCPTDTFHVLDTDFGSYDKLLATAFTDLTNVKVTVVEEWEETVDAVKQAMGEIERDDWLVIDSITPTWDMVQGWFVDAVHGVDVEEFFLQKRKALQQIRDNAKPGAQVPKGFAAISGEDGDWQVINKYYFALYRLLRNCKGHVYISAEQDKIGKDDEAVIKNTFGPYGAKPKGQKKLGHVPDSVFMLTKSRGGVWAITTIKDRGREELEEVEFDNFATTYLMKCAGWRPTKVGE